MKNKLSKAGGATYGANNPEMVTASNVWVPLEISIVCARQKVMGFLCNLKSFSVKNDKQISTTRP